MKEWLVGVTGIVQLALRGWEAEHWAIPKDLDCVVGHGFSSGLSLSGCMSVDTSLSEVPVYWL